MSSKCRFRRQTVRVEVKTAAIVKPNRNQLNREKNAAFGSGSAPATKFRNFVARAEPGPKAAFFRDLGYGTVRLSRVQPTDRTVTSCRHCSGKRVQQLKKT